MKFGHNDTDPLRDLCAEVDALAMLAESFESFPQTNTPEVFSEFKRRIEKVLSANVVTPMGVAAKDVARELADKWLRSPPTPVETVIGRAAAKAIIDLCVSTCEEEGRRLETEESRKRPEAQLSAGAVTVRIVNRLREIDVASVVVSIS